MPSQTGSIDLKATREAHNEASKVATDYVTDVSDGASFHANLDESTQVIIADGKIQMWAPDGKVAEYGSEAIIGREKSYHIAITGQRMAFMNDEAEIAWMTGERLHIPSVVVVNSMQAGNWLWDAGTSANHMTLKWNEEV